jgi:hypothetical protein
MTVVTRWIQSALDCLDRPLALFAVAVFLLALRRAER